MMKSSEEPIRRVAATIIAYAIRDGARRIRIETRPNEKIAVRVYYRDYEGNWQEHIKLPAYVLAPLFDELERLAGQTQAHVFKMPMPLIQSELEWHLTFDLAPDADGNRQAIILFDFRNPTDPIFDEIIS